ncbi:MULTISPECIES: hypothetical protein [unclassified Streptomyces]|uniref:SbtR family transcriptional regulator n=1 Tax=unclassified Streptomyces TaxID=2593676 RepID=UPI002D218712|nr:hypothetical protein [Streptomyces sp. HmicA12]
MPRVLTGTDVEAFTLCASMAPAEGCRSLPSCARADSRSRPLSWAGSRGAGVRHAAAVRQGELAGAGGLRDRSRCSCSTRQPARARAKPTKSIMATNSSVFDEARDEMARALKQLLNAGLEAGLLRDDVSGRIVLRALGGSCGMRATGRQDDARHVAAILCDGLRHTPATSTTSTCTLPHPPNHDADQGWSADGTWDRTFPGPTEEGISSRLGAAVPTVYGLPRAFLPASGVPSQAGRFRCSRWLFRGRAAAR